MVLYRHITRGIWRSHVPKLHPKPNGSVTHTGSNTQTNNSWGVKAFAATCWCLTATLTKSLFFLFGGIHCLTDSVAMLTLMTPAKSARSLPSSLSLPSAHDLILPILFEIGAPEYTFQQLAHSLVFTFQLRSFSVTMIFSNNSWTKLSGIDD